MPTFLKVWDGAAWRQAHTVRVWDGSSWIAATAVRVWDGSAWRLGYASYPTDPPTGLDIFNEGGYAALGSWDNPRGFDVEISWFFNNVLQATYLLGAGATIDSYDFGTGGDARYSIRYYGSGVYGPYANSASVTVTA